MKEWQSERQVSELENKAIDIYCAGLAGGSVKVLFETEKEMDKGLSLVDALRNVDMPKEFATGTLAVLAGALSGELAYNLACKKFGWEKNRKVGTVFILTGSMIGAGAMMAISNNMA